jgi:hypothetical protein
VTEGQACRQLWTVVGSGRRLVHQQMMKTLRLSTMMTKAGVGRVDLASMGLR